MEPKHTNQLAGESSPYLLQHAHNPVDWHAWSSEVLEQARQEQKPILLSIGYSACHWCHVMERESFENDEIAALMNRHFINIKVDREERPDLDQIYQSAIQLITGRAGGWPLTVFLTPDGKPFYGGTYFPPQDRFNIPGFPKVLHSIAQVFREKPDAIEESTTRIMKGLHLLSHHQPAQQVPTLEEPAQAVQALIPHMDSVHGGLRGAPKFPNTMVLSLLLRHHRSTGNQDALNPVIHTLLKMAGGGIYDHLGGGFHRYSVDEKWLVPHFEKMLYDNSQLIGLYLEAYQVTGETRFKQIVTETIGYVRREMTSPEGGFYATQDADSEGVEGKYFVWTPGEVLEILGQETGRIFCHTYDVTGPGNFEGQNILHTDQTLQAIAQEFNQTPDAIARQLETAREKLLTIREKRVPPFRDEKILTSWNALMISAATQAYMVLRNPADLEMARRGADMIYRHLQQDQRLLSVYKDGAAKLNGYLDDYAFFIAALLDLYEATFEPTYMEQADTLAQVMVDQFWNTTPGSKTSAEHGGFYFTGVDHGALITRTMTAHDHSIPSGNGIAAMDLLRLYFHGGREEYLKKAEQVLQLFGQAIIQNPFGHASLYQAVDYYQNHPKEVVLVGRKDSPEAREMLSKIHSVYCPNKTLTFLDPDQPVPPRYASSGLVNREKPGPLTVYVCQNFTCSVPLTEWAPLKALLTQSTREQ